MIVSERNKKKNFILYFCLTLLVSGGIFFLTPSVASAAPKWVSDLGTAVTDNVLGALATPFKALIYAVFVFAGWLASAALTLFEWVIKPENISGDTGLLNQPNIYELWKFIRDFFNLFFILVLLYIAFTVVFQIQKNFKQALLSLVLAALFVNFSYPVSRALIDATNVPMYFFANQITGINAADGAFGQALSVSNIKGILLPGAQDEGDIAWIKTPLARFLAAAIFMFLFAITLVVLALMFVVRLVALMILVVFSSVGFAASIIPGLDKYSKMWWDNFWKYTLFGPAAMLMLLVATRFFSAMNNENAGVFSGLTMISGSISTEPTFIASLAMFSFPIIVLWMAIGLAQTMSIAGAASVVGKGQMFAKWAGKKTYNNPIGRGLGGGIKQRVENNKVGKFLTPKFWNSPSKIEAGIKGWTAKTELTTRGAGRKGARTELDKIRYRKALDDAEEYKKNRMAHSEARAKMAKGGDEAAGAALYLAGDKGLTSAEDLTAAVQATAHDRDMLAKVMSGAQDSAVGDLTSAQHASIQEVFYARDDKGNIRRDEKNPNERMIDETKKEAYGSYNDKLKKEGKIDIRVDHEIKARVDDTGVDRNQARDDVYKQFVGSLGAEDLVKQTDLHKGETGQDLKQYFQAAVTSGDVSTQRVQKIVEKAMEKGKQETQKTWLGILDSTKDVKGKPTIEVVEGYRTRPKA